MKKYFLTTLALLPFAACAQDPNIKAYCNNIWKTSSPGIVNISSEHGVAVSNKSKITLVYHIEFDNAVQYGKLREMPLDYSDPPFTPNAHMEYDLRLEPGKTYYYGPVNIDKNAYFEKRGRYQTKAITTIKIGSAILDKCEHITNVDIA